MSEGEPGPAVPDDGDAPPPDPDGVLGLAARRRLFEAIQAYPGLHLRACARLAGLDPNHAKYHLGRLERSGLASSRVEGGHRLLFPTRDGPLGPQEALTPDEKAALAVLRQPVPLHATLLLLDRLEARHAELEAALPVTRTTLHYHMRKLERAGLVASDLAVDGRRYRLADPDRVRALLRRYRPPGRLVRGFLEAWEAVGL